MSDIQSSSYQVALVKCGQHRCYNLATHSYYWPDHDGPLFICGDCVGMLERVSKAIGLEPNITPIAAVLVSS